MSIVCPGTLLAALLSMASAFGNIADINKNVHNICEMDEADAERKENHGIKGIPEHVQERQAFHHSII